MSKVSLFRRFRVKQVSRRTGLAAVLLACYCTVAVAQWQSAPDEFQNKLLTMGTGPDIGSFSPIGDALCEMVNSHRRSTLVRCVRMRSAGSIFNIHAVANGSLQWGIAQENLVVKAYKDTSRNDGRGLRVVALVHESPISITVRKASGITALDQIRQGVVNLGYPGSGLAANMVALLAALNLSTKDLAGVARLPSVPGAQAFCDGKVDVILNASAHPTEEIRKLRACGGEFLEIPPKVIETMMAGDASLRRMDIAQGLYDPQQKVVRSIGSRNLLFSSAAVDPEAIYRVATLINRNLSTLQSTQPLLSSMRRLQAADVDALDLPVHPGALRALNEGARQ